MTSGVVFLNGMFVKTLVMSKAGLDDAQIVSLK